MNFLELASRIGIQGFLHCSELQKLVDLACNKDVLEIGSYKGLSAWGMACVARSMTCVDTFAAHTDGQRQSQSPLTLRDFLQATSRFSPAMLTYFVGPSREAASAICGEFDLIFVDAMHDYASASLDITLWWPRLRPGGIMAFHDYGAKDYPGVQQAVDERFGPAQEEDVCVTLRWVRK